MVERTVAGIVMTVLVALHAPDLSVAARLSDRVVFLTAIGGAPDDSAPPPKAKPNLENNATAQERRIIGWVSGISAADGVISGWAADTRNPEEALTISFYTDAPPGYGGTLMGSAIANAVDFSVTYIHGLPGPHRFVFPIPARFKNGQNTTFFAQAVNNSGSVSQLLPGATNTFKLLPDAPTTVVTNTSCLAPRSRCASTAYDFGPPNFPWARGRDDGQDYFNIWDCKSPVGINHIVRLNIIPYGGGDGTRYHDENFQKDSLLVNLVDHEFGSPVIYFTSSRYNTYSTAYSLKKAVHGLNGDWQIFDMLDYPSSSGGFSSLDGRYPAFIMNDYSQPGWGPTSPYPGTSNYVPGVANVPANPEHNSFPLIGSGSAGLTTIVNTLQGRGVTDGGVQGRTCIHMNPKLFDYRAGVPQSMIAYMFQESVTGKASPCILPDGSRLPSVGYYVYHFNRAIGWQLDSNFGPIESSPDPDQAMKLVANANNHRFIAGNWRGEITIIDLDEAPPRTKQIVLACSASINGSRAKFGEATGNTSQVWFLGIPPGAPLTYGNSVFTGDIYYAYAGRTGNSRYSDNRLQ